MVVGTGTWRIENDGGAWIGSYTTVDADGFAVPNKVVRIGEGGYEGLVAVWQEERLADRWTIRGYLLSAPVPPVATLP